MRMRARGAIPSQIQTMKIGADDLILRFDALRIVFVLPQKIVTAEKQHAHHVALVELPRDARLVIPIIDMRVRREDRQQNPRVTITTADHRGALSIRER